MVAYSFWELSLASSAFIFAFQTAGSDGVLTPQANTIIPVATFIYLMEALDTEITAMTMVTAPTAVATVVTEAAGTKVAVVRSAQ
jgi:hypothetical protein